MAKKKINGTVVSDQDKRRQLHNDEYTKEPKDPFPNNSSYRVNPQNITFKLDDSIVTLADLMEPAYGGMLKYPETVVKGSFFENMTGEEAGVFYLDNGSLNLENCTFRNNEAKAPGSSNIVGDVALANMLSKNM